MPRKRNDVAGVFEKYPGSGIWYVRYRVNGKNVRRKIGDRIKAEKEHASILLSKSSGEYIHVNAVRGITLSDLSDKYLAHIDNEANPVRPRDTYGPKIKVRAIKATFKDRPAASVQPAEIRNWLMGLGVAPGTMNRYRSVLSSIYRYGKEESFVTVNPVRDMKQFRVELPNPRWLQQEEERDIRATLQRWITECPTEHKVTKLYLRCHPLELTFALGTGLRKRNQYSIRWDNHIDLPGRTIHLPPSMTKTGKQLDIPIIDSVYNALLEMQEIQADLDGLLPREDESRVRMMPDGRVFLISENREWWKQALKESKIKNLRWHDLRHTFATRLVAAGTHLSIVQKACGHSSHNTTTRYAHVDDSQLRAAMSRLSI